MVEVTLRNLSPGLRTIYDPTHKPLVFRPGEQKTVSVTEAVAASLAARDDLIVIDGPQFERPAPVALGVQHALHPPQPVQVCIPAWGSRYVEEAARWTVPAVMASLAAAGGPREVLLNIWTNTPDMFHAWKQHARFTHCAAYTTEFKQAEYRGMQTANRGGAWEAFKASHRHALASAPDGTIVCLLNADTVVSVETFSVVDRVFANPQVKAIVSVGIRTLAGAQGPPVGVEAETLAQWIWSHRHPITDGVIWGKGEGGHPTLIFFDDDRGNVSMHGLHLTPMFVRKEAGRNTSFTGTIDDDLMKHYRDDELHYTTDREFVVAELSFPEKRDRHTGRLISVEGVAADLLRGRAALRDRHHMRNFTKVMRVLGRPARHPAVDQILARLSGRA